MALITNNMPAEIGNHRGDEAPAIPGKSGSKASTDVSADGASRKPKVGGKIVRLPETKAAIVLKKLRSPKGATIEMLMEATNWQAHSVRGFLSGTVRKKLGLTVTNEVGKDGARRYRINDILTAG